MTPVSPGQELPSFTMHDIDLDRITEFMDLMGDTNPVHHDAQLAQSLGLRGPVAQGPASLAYVLNMLLRWRPDATLEQFSFRFHDIVTVGDEPTAHGRVEAVQTSGTGEQRIACDVSLDLDSGAQAVTGAARLRLPLTDAPAAAEEQAAAGEQA